MQNEISFPYIKLRKNFGRQVMFCEVPVHMIDSIEPNATLQKQYCLRNPMNHETQATMSQSQHQVNTKVIKFKDTGINHAEGGWPKDIHFADEELISRHRRRIERDEDYVNAVLNTAPKILHYIEQNNAIEIYEMYFKEMEPIDPVEKSTIHVNNVYRDPDNRQIGSMSWTHEDNAKIVVTYCDKKFPINRRDTTFSGSVWNLEANIFPENTFNSPSACWQIVCSPVDPSVLIGGLEDGRVCIFDLRAENVPVALNPMHLAHRDPVSSIEFVYSRINTEFFSGSTDGQCMWWDVRNLSFPTDKMTMSIFIPPGHFKNLSNAEPVSSLQYERSFPTKFLCGTDTGFAISVNRKGKSHAEIMSSVYHAHNGPVKTLCRNPFISKMFVTCGDWTAHVWSEDISISPIVSGLAQRHQVNDVVWAPHRVSAYMTVSADGKFRYWDLLRKYRDPVLVSPLSKFPLLKIKPHEEGRLIAVGDKKGRIYLVGLSDNLVYSADKDKQRMVQTYERETRRERILETRVKEIRLKLKSEDIATGTAPVDVVDEGNIIQAAEYEYKRVVREETQRVGVTQIYPKAPMMRRR